MPAISRLRFWMMSPGVSRRTGWDKVPFLNVAESLLIQGTSVLSLK
jgi:hypothetical protein